MTAIMKIVYVHGLDSSANSVKGKLLEQYCKQYHPDIEVIRPDLNDTPDKVFEQLCGYIEQEQGKSKEQVKKSQVEKEQVVLVGSSLGGYFSTLVSNERGCPALLLNPSTEPHITLQRFVSQSFSKDDLINDSANGSSYKKSSSYNKMLDKVVYQTKGGWHVTLRDLEWFRRHTLTEVTHPKKVIAIIKEGDELLNPAIATDFYRNHGVQVDLQRGGDHRMTDFQTQLPQVMRYISLLIDTDMR